MILLSLYEWKIFDENNLVGELSVIQNRIALFLFDKEKYRNEWRIKEKGHRFIRIR